MLHSGKEMSKEKLEIFHDFLYSGKEFSKEKVEGLKEVDFSYLKFMLTNFHVSYIIKYIEEIFVNHMYF